MANKTNGNNPASPCTPPFHVDYTNWIDYSGLTKREYFAAMAMSGIVSNSAELIVQLSYESIAEDSIRIADALIKELNK